MENLSKLQNYLSTNTFLDREQTEELRKMEQMSAELNFEILQSQFNLSHEGANFDHITGSFLLLSDRLDQMAHELGAFIKKKTCAQVLGVISNENELKEQMLDADYLIVVGYLQDEENFKILNKMRSNNQAVTPVFYATYSPLTRKQMEQHSVYCVFERHEPLNNFLKLFS